MQSSFKPFKDLINVLAYAPGLILAFLSMALRFKALQQTSFVNGWDGYFYLVQLKSWIEEGAMHSADQSLIYPLMRGVHWFSNDYVLTYKLTAALIAGLVTFGVFHVAKRWSGNLYIAILLGSISLFSPHLTYFAAQFPKNLLGFAFLLFFMASLEGSSKKTPYVWLLLCFFGHRLTFGVALIFGGIWVAAKHLSIKKIALLLASLGILFILSLLIPGLPNLSDFQRFDGLLSWNFQFAPYSFVETFGTDNRISHFWMAEIIVAVVIYFLCISFLFQKGKRWLVWTLFGLSTFLLFPFYTWDLTGMAYRFFLLYVLLAPLFIPLLLKLEKSKTNKASLLFITILFMLGSIYSWRSYHPEKHDAAYKKYAKLTSNTLKYLDSTNTDLVISHNALAEYFTFTTGIDAMPWNPEYEIETTKLWRIATDIRASEMQYYLNEDDMESVHKIGIRYFLMPEYLWQKILSEATKKGDDFLLEKLNTWRNPHRIRPGFLLKKK